jgi:murein DD-endopeptidase MepM/ murein hydrolase activator NlpD
MRSFLVSLAAVIISATGCAARTASRPSPHQKAEPIVERATGPSEPERQASRDTQEAEAADGVVHIVQPGQTLWRIARAYDIDIGRLAETNGIDDPTHVDVGTPLFVPGARATIMVAPFPAPPPSARVGPAAPSGPPADFLWPVAGGAFMRPFGEPRRHHTHAGVDIRGTRGQDILAARDGVVAFCGGTRTGYGTMVVLDHGDGIQTLYAHAQKTLVKQGDPVRRGQPIALLGRTGNATTEHCHFEIRLENRAIDPMPYILGTTEAHR